MTYEDFAEEWRSPLRYVTAHTSGSTGTPKEIRLSKHDMELSAKATIDFFGIRRGDLLATPLAADYIAGKMMAVRAFIAGATLLDERPSRKPLSGVTENVKLAAIVPQQIEGLVDAPCPIEHVIVGGAPVSPEAERLAASRVTTAWWATYGMTETCSHVALRRFGESCYTALPGVIFTTDRRGCLVINRKGASWSPVTTNDIVTLLSPASFVFRGRADNAIISGGLKIHPEEVEQIIAPAFDGRRFYITGIPSERWGEEPLLVVEGAADSDGGKALVEACAALAGRVKRPRSVRFIPQFKLTSSGKIIRLRD